MKWILLLAAFGCATEPPPVPKVPTDVPLELALPAARGNPIDIATLRGNVVVLDVMATWSVASQSEVPMFQRLLATYGERGLRVISIAMDSQTPQLVTTWIDTLGVSWPMALATSDVLEGRSPLGRIPEIPRTIILDRKGYVRFDRSGTIPAAELAKVIESLL
jgi:cytochrome c biogenesis protein CcmG, thiol:disulfide interchange protein DsbE